MYTVDAAATTKQQVRVSSCPVVGRPADVPAAVRVAEVPRVPPADPRLRRRDALHLRRRRLLHRHDADAHEEPVSEHAFPAVVKLLSKRWWIPVGVRLEGLKLEPEGPRAELGFLTADHGFSSIQGTLFGFVAFK